ncbi:MAG: hypothetical protein NTZ26_09760 [Candidatus Aminicenantes bacterium]|nr:hypothetical protein [Candidatus Aminicenantes bacterium]
MGIGSTTAQIGIIRCSRSFANWSLKLTGWPRGCGSEGEETAGSDLDLFIVGSITLRALTPKLSGLAEEIGREINPFAITVEELRDRIERKDHFVSRVLASPKLFVIGDENELGTMGGKRLD